MELNEEKDSFSEALKNLVADLRIFVIAFKRLGVNIVNLVKSIANKTRGPYTPEKYGNVIIPMAIIRRFDCILASKNKDIAKIVEACSKIKDITSDLQSAFLKVISSSKTLASISSCNP